MKKELIVIGVVAVIVLVGGYLVLSERGYDVRPSEGAYAPRSMPLASDADQPREASPDPSLQENGDKGWLHYRNDVWGISFLYPLQGEIVAKGSNQVIVQGLDPIFYPSLLIGKNIEGVTLDEFAKPIAAREGEYGFVDDYRRVEIGGQPGVYYSTSEMGGTAGIVVTPRYIYTFGGYGLWKKFGILETVQIVP